MGKTYLDVVENHAIGLKYVSNIIQIMAPTLSPQDLEQEASRLLGKFEVRIAFSASRLLGEVRMFEVNIAQMFDKKQIFLTFVVP